MLSRLFLISTLLLVWITTIAIGAPVAETIEGIKAVKIPQMESGNHTLNRRYIDGVPGLPQCSDEYPLLVYSRCLTEYTIRAWCTSVDDHGSGPVDTPCPPETKCKGYRTEPVSQMLGVSFAVCVGDNEIKTFDNDDKSGVFCKTYDLEDGTQATLSFDIYDQNQDPAPVKSIGIDYGNQHATLSDTPKLSMIVDLKKNQKVQVCMNIATYSGLLIGMFSYLNGVYSSNSIGGSSK